MKKSIPARERIFITGLFTVLFSCTVTAQPTLELPRTSQKAAVSQRIGITDITVSYHRPGVKGRQIWGGLVPFDEVWRTGANEKTTITFSDAVEIAGRSFDAGSYAIFTIPHRDSVTIILSGNTSGWGTQYDPADDLLRFDVLPVPAEHTEWMEFAFMDLSDTGATLALHWTDRLIPVRISVSTPEIVLDHARAQIAAGPDSAVAILLRTAAAYAERQNIHTAEALDWINRSLAVRRTLQALCVKADLLTRNGEDAGGIVDEAVSNATAEEMDSYARTLRREGRADRALELLLKFTQRNDDAWLAHRSLGETYAALDDPASAKEQYEIALRNAPAGKEADRIRELIVELDAK